MFPLSDSIRSGKIPFATLLLIALNMFVFFKQLTVGSDLLITQYALIPKNINLLIPISLLPFVTSIFLHGGFFHILSNMWFLWIFGDNVEAKIGKIKFLLLFFLAGIAGNVLQYILSTSSPIPMLGASGAVSGILGAYIVLLPKAKIKTILFIFFIFTVAEIPAFIYIFYWFLLQLFSGFASLSFSFQSGGVAFWAHVGGFLFGRWFTKKLDQANPSPRQNYIEGEIVG